MVEQLTQHDPRRIGPFEVLSRLGAGGMGLVYLARSASGRRVAIKTVRTELAEDQLFRVRFTREVEAARAVSGFYTAAVVDADPRAPVPWLATAYVPAPSLEEIVNECGPLPAPAVRWLAAGIAEALQSIHGAGLVHRDLKPSNVLVVEDGPRVIDFGIASGVSNTRLTMTNVAVGTPAYMSPEQAKDSRSVTGASDVFSLGSTLVFAATGHAPYHGANPVETVFMLLREGPDLEGLPEELRPLIESCMQMEAPLRPSPADLQAQRPWRFRMSNDVWGTPTLAGDLVYVTSFEVHALDVATGRRRFKTRDVAWSMAVADGRIHASDGPTLYALDAADGSDLWRMPTDAWVYSLKADRGTVVTGTRGGGVQAWEAANGEKLWELTGAQTDFETPEAGPVVHDGTVYVWQDARLRALEARTGQERWSYPIGDAASCGGVPVRLTQASDGYVYVAAGTRALAIDVLGGHVRWHFESPAVFLSPPAFAPGPAVTGGGVYLTDYLGTVYALDATDGRDRWRIATEARSATEPVLVSGGHVHVGSGKGLYTLDAVTGTPKWRFQAGGEVIGSPVAAGGRIHFGSADHCLYTLDAAGGQLRWKLATGGEITGTPVVHGNVVYACSKDRCVYALDAVKGTGTAPRP
ncbi:outer membrane protein assembly factor BamB family protein [Streptomyces sp. SM8]|uniref:outer membrane protein assembly factor BamB family protein n=1 Tax=Streptomyces sp. SM8 TaxID=1195457 RepID=UPI000C2B4AD3|nr:PQQ-binding-like beta-propeller repeat protein [Streptomyces sp. SM8]PKA34965.1 hypothetical protein SM8_012335 [Streptomyces sp. SM8]